VIPITLSPTTTKIQQPQDVKNVSHNMTLSKENLDAELQRHGLPASESFRVSLSLSLSLSLSFSLSLTLAAEQK
jgi:hypothetical protein